MPIVAASLALVLAATLSGCGGGDAASATETVANAGSVSQPFADSRITITGNALDIAIRGPGFFQVTADHSPPMYTRIGRFQVDADGYIVNDAQMRLMGQLANAAGDIDRGAPSVPLKVSTRTLPPQVTDRITIAVNLDPRLPATCRGAQPSIDFSDPATFNNATALAVYDVRGQPVTLGIYFQKCDVAGGPLGSIAWNVFATANGLPVGGAPAAPVTTLVFAADGSAPIGSSGTVTLPEIVAGAYANGATVVPLTGVVLNLAGSTQYGASFVVDSIRQTGTPPGGLESIGFKPDGMLTGTFSNGRTLAIGQVELATFGDPRCLQSVGSNAWVGTRACTTPGVAAPGSGGFGVLQAGAVETP